MEQPHREFGARRAPPLISPTHAFAPMQKLEVLWERQSQPGLPTYGRTTTPRREGHSGSSKISHRTFQSGPKPTKGSDCCRATGSRAGWRVAEGSARREARGPTDDPLSLSRCSACGCRPMGVEVKGYASKSDDMMALSQGRLILKIRGSSSADKTCGAVNFSIASSSATGAIDDDCVQLRRQRRR